MSFSFFFLLFLVSMKKYYLKFDADGKMKEKDEQEECVERKGFSLRKSLFYSFSAVVSVVCSNDSVLR
jgi:hypothetical protein